MIHLEISDHHALIQYPVDYYPAEQVETHLHDFYRITLWDLSQQLDTCTLRIETQNGDIYKSLQALFAQLNGYPDFTAVDINTYVPAPHPLVSCIILLTANDQFVVNHLIPSILQNSQGYDIEILIVYNGVGVDLSQFAPFDVSQSEFGCVSKGYNQGARRSRGQYLAIFHDDCMLADPHWISTCLDLLQDGYVAVTPELEKNTRMGSEHPFWTAKDVPLVIAKESFFQLGGYDETYYIGYEDIDFTYTILSRHQKVAKAKINYFHFNGMSTVLMFSKQLTYFKELFAYHLLPKRIIFDLRNFYIRQIIQISEIFQLDEQQLSYFLSKFDPYWIQIGHHPAIEFRARFNQPQSHYSSILLANRETMLELIQKNTTCEIQINETCPF